jgi:sec-independent protein translocase protein TatC
MNFINELKKFISNILSWVYVLAAFSFLFFGFASREIIVKGKHLFIPWPSMHSFSVQILEKIQNDLLPAGVQLIVTSPLAAFLSQVIVSLFLAFVLTFPYFLYRIISYLFPALLGREKKIVLLILTPSVLLFFAGCFFAYSFVIPTTFGVLYQYATVMGAVTFFSVQEFISLVLGMMMAVGTMFLMPVFMVFLTFLGLVSSDFWKNNWRYSVLIFLIFSAIITPDGTGITMTMLAFPMAGLYFLGTIATSRNKKGRISSK